MFKFYLFALTGVCASALAAEKPVQVDFDNFGGSSATLVAEDLTLKTFYKEDGTFITINESAPEGEWAAKGTWRLDQKNLCTRYIESRIRHEVDTTETCMAIPVANYGESWTVTDVDIGEVRITLAREDTEVPF